jgi:hypothetical protein
VGFTTFTLPPVDPEAFLKLPLMERIKTLSLHWVDFGFGVPRMVHVIYLVKLAVFYVLGFMVLVTLTSDLPAFWHVSQWWDQPIVYQKAILWTVLLELLGLAGSWGPLAGKTKPMTGGYRFWARPNTIRLRPWRRVPFTAGDRRTWFDIGLYLVLVIGIVVPLVVPGVPSVSLSDALPDNTSGLVDLKLLIVTVWFWAGVSKFGMHFTNVIPPMVSNSPSMPLKWLKRKHYRNFPDDLLPSHLATFMAHGLGTVVEIISPAVLLFSPWPWLTIVAVAIMVGFHLFIISTFPMAVPLEWNALFAYAVVFLFLGFPNGNGYAIWDMSSVWLTLLLLMAFCFFPVLGNLRPDLVSFLPAMRQYAGNWASAVWAFAPGAEEKLNRVTRSAGNQVDQLVAYGFTPLDAELFAQKALGWRAMHSQGRGLCSVLLKNLPDVDTRSVREAEVICNTLVGFNFGDGHLHDEDLIRAVQDEAAFEPGELVIVWVESQPIHRKVQHYKVIDAALGVVERGTWKVADVVAEQPWLPNGPIPLHVTWSRDRHAEAG